VTGYGGTMCDIIDRLKYEGGNFSPLFAGLTFNYSKKKGF
jgi:hypothetical protein